MKSQPKRPAAPWLPKPLPWEPPWYDDTIIYAIRALSKGAASEGQQQLAWKYLMFVTGASEEFADLSFRSDDRGGTHGMIFSEGKRFVGMMIRKMLRPELTPNKEQGDQQQVQQSMQHRRKRKNPYANV